MKESDNVRVIVRCRPMNETEKSSNCTLVVKVRLTDSILLIFVLTYIRHPPALTSSVLKAGSKLKIIVIHDVGNSFETSIPCRLQENVFFCYNISKGV